MYRATIFFLLISLLSACPIPALAKEGGSSTYSEAVALYKSGQYARALEGFEGVFGKDPHNVNALYYVADCLLRTGDASRASFCYKQIMAKFPSTVAAQYARRALLGVARTNQAGGGTGASAGTSTDGGGAEGQRDSRCDA